MGYYTGYGLSVTPDKGYEEDEQKFYDALLERTRYENGPDPEVEELVNTGGVYAKLYDLTDVIEELAPDFPHLLIILSGDGEASDDLWEERWKGKEQETQFSIIPPFTNPALLTETEKVK